MKSYNAALWVELLKVRRSKIVWITTLIISIMPFVGGLFMIILKDPERARSLGLIGSKAQLVAGTADWSAYFSMLNQTIAIIGLLLFGFISVWVFGREYSDRTMKDLLALPSPRWSIVAAKFTVIAGWSVLLSVWALALGFAVGFAVDVPGWSAELASRSAGNFLTIAGLTIAVIAPVCLAANIGRGYLSPLGVLIGLLLAAQVLGVMGWGDYFPWSIPALHGTQTETSSGQTSIISYLIVMLTGIAGLVATFVWWNRADQTR
ncbi:MAG: ABC transporter permease [Dehalococcoidales bacterium]|nr:ABC transporter permease [Dehalococcoidales bacterium]